MVLKINKGIVKRGVSMFELSILIVSLFAFAHFIFLSTPNIGIVSAAGDDAGCCVYDGQCSTLTRDSCNGVDGSFDEFVSCTQSSLCDKVCCVNEEEGTYSKNVIRNRCEERGGTIEEDSNCNVPGARSGCCVLGDSTVWTTQQNCIFRSETLSQGASGSFDSSSRGIESEWRTDLSEAQCALLTGEQKKGACIVIEQNSNGEEIRDCFFGSEFDCASENGIFSENNLCTSEELNTVCEKTDNTECFEGLDGVYFVDSCGNRANIYDASKVNDDGYWNRIIEREDSCGYGDEDANADSSECGNCNRFRGSICASSDENNFDVDYGNNYCKDISCTFDGETYKNGESWCVYDGKVGEGDDVVGSRHWKYVCSQGEVLIEPCADYRNEICVQSSTQYENGDEFVNANCRVNNWRACLNLNNQANNGSSCSEEPDCYVKTINMGGSFNFNICVPEYPAGFSLDERGQSSGETICSYATRTCTVIYKKSWGSCECAENCACEKQVFTEEMNDLCRSLGDCGGHVNVEGEYSGAGYSVSGAPGGVNVANLIKMADPSNFPGQFAYVGNLTKYLRAIGILGFGDEDSDDSSDSGEDEEDGGGIGATEIGLGATGIGLAIAAYSWYDATVVGTEGTIGFLDAIGNGFGGAVTDKVVIEGATKEGLISLAPNSVPPWLGGFANTALGFGTIIGFASLIAGFLGIQADPTTTIAGAVVGLYAAFETQTALVLAEAYGSYALAITEYAVDWGVVYEEVFLGGFDPISLGVGVAVAVAIMWLFSDSGFFGIGACEPKTVTFTCQPWQAPTGGSDCDKCDDDPLKPCSEYRCNSLGSACVLINKGSDEEMCVEDNPNDVSPPQLEPLRDNLSDGYRYRDIDGDGFSVSPGDGDCFEAFSSPVFGFLTNEPAQCKFDLEENEFENMQFYFGTNAYVENHTMTYFLPSPEGCGLNWTGDLRFHVKCQDTHGNEIPEFYNIDVCVNSGADETAPLIRAVLPGNNSMVSFNSTEKEIYVYTNEPADCRWSTTDEDYSLMENDFNCNNACNQLGIYGYQCSTDVTIDSPENDFFIRCEDQPLFELINRSSDRNANSESYLYRLIKPESELEIVSVEPNDDYEVNTRTSTMELIVETSGGGNYVTCSYSFSDFDNLVAFNDFDGNNVHEQVFDMMSIGKKKIYIECTDETSTVVREQVNFEIIYDSTTPQLSRTWQDNGRLHFITTENAECRYSTDSLEECNFDFDDGEDAGGSSEHSINFVKGNTYYIRCEDEFGNKPSGCSFILRTS